MNYRQRFEIAQRLERKLATGNGVTLSHDTAAKLISHLTASPVEVLQEDLIFDRMVRETLPSAASSKPLRSIEAQLKIAYRAIKDKLDILSGGFFKWKVVRQKRIMQR